MLPSYRQRVPGRKLLPRVYQMTLILSTGSTWGLQGRTLTMGSIIFSLLVEWFRNSRRIFSPSAPEDLSTEATNPRSLTLFRIISISSGKISLLSPTYSLSLFKMARTIYFSLPLFFALAKSSINVGISSCFITSSVRDKQLRIVIGVSLKSSRARLTSSYSPLQPILLSTRKHN